MLSFHPDYVCAVRVRHAAFYLAFSQPSADRNPSDSLEGGQSFQSHYAVYAEAAVLLKGDHSFLRAEAKIAGGWTSEVAETAQGILKLNNSGAFVSVA